MTTPGRWSRVVPILRLRWRLYRLDRRFRSLLAKAKRDQRERIKRRYLPMLRVMHEDLQIARSQRLLRRAQRLNVAPPILPADGREDENWKETTLVTPYGKRTTFFLQPAGVALVRRGIEDAKKRRREAWESWLKIKVWKGRGEE